MTAGRLSAVWGRAAMDQAVLSRAALNRTSAGGGRPVGTERAYEKEQDQERNLREGEAE